VEEAAVRGRRAWEIPLTGPRTDSWQVELTCLMWPSSSWLELASNKPTDNMGQSLLAKLTVAQLVKKFPVFYATGKFVSMFTRAGPTREPDESRPHAQSLFLHRPDDGSSKHLWSVGQFPRDHKAQNPRRQTIFKIYLNILPSSRSILISSHLCLGLPRGSFLLLSNWNFVRISHLHTCCMSIQTDHPYIWWSVQTVNLLITFFSSTPCSLFSNPPQHFVPKHLRFGTQPMNGTTQTHEDGVVGHIWTALALCMQVAVTWLSQLSRVRPSTCDHMIQCATPRWHATPSWDDNQFLTNWWSQVADRTWWILGSLKMKSVAC
jgi:hypothetical protein